MDFLSTPLLVTVILGSVGLAIPIIDSLRKERGAGNKLYCGISVGAIILIIGIISIRVLHFLFICASPPTFCFIQ